MILPNGNQLQSNKLSVNNERIVILQKDKLLIEINIVYKLSSKALLKLVLMPLLKPFYADVKLIVLQLLNKHLKRHTLIDVK